MTCIVGFIADDGIYMGADSAVNRLFRFDPNYQVTEYVDEYTAIGSGEEIALGALAATVGEPTKQRIEKALLAAEKFDCGVQGPFTYFEIKKV